MGWIGLLAVIFLAVGSYAFFSCLFRDVGARQRPVRRPQTIEQALLAHAIVMLEHRDELLRRANQPKPEAPLPAADPSAPHPYRHSRRVRV